MNKKFRFIKRRHCEEENPTKQSRKVTGLPRSHYASEAAKLRGRYGSRDFVASSLKWSLAMTIILVFIISPAFAEPDCRNAFGKEILGPFEIVKGMADYKAAMDAGYAACTVQYPQEFAPLRSVNDFMQTNMQRELDEARAVLEHLVERQVETECVESAKVDMGALIEGQYKKAYSRRYRAIQGKDLVDRDQDSCLIVLDMVKKYDEHYGDFKQLEFVLYESSKKQGKANGAASGRAYKQFEKARADLVKKPVSDQGN